MDQEGQVSSSHATLEDQLRSMILSNGEPSRNGVPAPQYTRPSPANVSYHERGEVPVNNPLPIPRPPQLLHEKGSMPSYKRSERPPRRQPPDASRTPAYTVANAPRQGHPPLNKNSKPVNVGSRHSSQPQQTNLPLPPRQEFFVKAPRILQRPASQSPAALQVNGTFHGSDVSKVSAPVPQSPVPFRSAEEVITAQCMFLDHVAAQELPNASMSLEEYSQKESFRGTLERLCHEVVVDELGLAADTFRLHSFGSLASGFATQGSDMDLAALTSIQDMDLPRRFEKKLLDMGYGARCLTRTRVPILKVCEQPPAELYAALCAEHQKWEDSPPDERDKTPEEIKRMRAAKEHKEAGAQPGQRGVLQAKDAETKVGSTADVQANAAVMSASPVNDQAPDEEERDKAPFPGLRLPKYLQQQNVKPWIRERKLGPLDFPKDGIGIQCDINFGNPLGVHNTALLRCYSLCDDRVRPMVLFVKAWAKRRKINSSYNGTLSSYGYVLMVLHYLVNVAYPPVIPNLQLAWKPPQSGSWTFTLQEEGTCNGYNIRFWRNEDQIRDLAARKMLTHNHWSLSRLLRDFFAYYSQNGMHVPAGGFSWRDDVLSLRTPGGLISKQGKGWTGAKTEVTETKEVKHRYLFAIEDPFEVDHNVARTVTHNGIVAIRDEFKRAWRILQQVGRGQIPEGELFAFVVEKVPDAADEHKEQEVIGNKQVEGIDNKEPGVIEGTDIGYLGFLREVG